MTSPASSITVSSLGEIDPLFKHPRGFSREAANRPYLHYLRDNFGDIDYSDDESDDESDNGHPGTADDAGGNGGPTDDEPVDPDPAPLSAVKYLSKGLVEIDEPSPDPHQDSQVVMFVEHGLKIKLGSCDGDDQTVVALIDDQIDTVGGQPCRGGLTRSGLRDHLNQPRFTEPDMVPSHSGGQLVDINRRVIGLPGLAAQEMEILAETVPMYQKGTLMKFYRHHINPSPAIEYDMPSSGFRTLSPQFHIPHLVLRQHRTPRKDPRQKPNGDPLRGCWIVDCIPASKPHARWYLYEAQYSLAVVITDERVWTAFGTADSFFDRTTSAAYRHNSWANSIIRDQITVDPIISGRTYLAADALLSDPSRYFLAKLESVIKTVQCEYGPIITMMQEVVNNGHPAEATGQIEEFGAWNDGVLEHVRRSMTFLSDLLEAWKTFQDADPPYIHVDANGRYLSNIKGSFRILEKYHKKLADLEKELKRNEAKINQQLNVQNRDAQTYSQALAFIIVAFLPLSLAMSVFNMQGLPFRLSPASFGLSLVAFTCMWAVVYSRVMRGIAAMDPLMRFWRVYARPHLGYAATRTRKMAVSIVWGGKLGGVFELEGSTPSGGSTTARQDPGHDISEVPRAATWPMFSRRRRNEREDDPGQIV